MKMSGQEPEPDECKGLSLLYSERTKRLSKQIGKDTDGLYTERLQQNTESIKKYAQTVFSQPKVQEATETIERQVGGLTGEQGVEVNPGNYEEILEEVWKLMKSKILGKDVSSAM